MSLFAPTTAESRRKLIYGVSACALVVFIGLGIFANNGWLPHTDALTGRKTGWFGRELPNNAGSTWNPFADPLPTPTPQLSKEYIYSGQRLLAVEDANAIPCRFNVAFASNGGVASASSQYSAGYPVTG